MGNAPGGMNPGKGKKGADKKKKQKFQAKAATRVGRKRRKKGADAVNKLPRVTPGVKCKLRLLKWVHTRRFPRSQLCWPLRN